MRRVIVISYTETGGKLNNRVAEALKEIGDVALSFLYRMNFMSTNELLEKEWHRTSAFVFVGAMGIAVRHIAPFLQNKVRDPAVLVMDEKGQFVIPVLSGHIGGGVALAEELAQAVGAQAVITTATDTQGMFAVDTFAGQNHLFIESPCGIREVSAALLKGDTVDVYTGLSVTGEIPRGLCVHGLAEGAVRKGKQGIIFRTFEDGCACVLYPRQYIVGIGCKKGKSADELETFLTEICEQAGIEKWEIAAVASIDVKREEEGIWELSRRLHVPYEVFSAEELGGVEEAVQPSLFVKETVGVDNVCERSAYYLAGKWSRRRKECTLEKELSGGTETAVSAAAEDKREEATGNMTNDGGYRLLLGKQVKDGMTMAVVKFMPEISFVRCNRSAPK